MSLEPKRVNALRDLLIKKNINENQLSLKTGIDPSTINRWVNNQRRPSLDAACKLAAGLGVSLKELAAYFGVDVTDIPDDVPPTDQK